MKAPTVYRMSYDTYLCTCFVCSYGMYVQLLESNSKSPGTFGHRKRLPVCMYVLEQGSSSCSSSSSSRLTSNILLHYQKNLT